MEILNQFLALWTTAFVPLFLGFVASIIGFAIRRRLYVLTGAFFALLIPLYMALGYGQYIYLLTPLFLLVAAFTLKYNKGLVAAGSILIALIPATYLTAIVIEEELEDLRQAEAAAGELRMRMEAAEEIIKRREAEITQD